MIDYILGVSDPKQWHSEVLICHDVSVMLLCTCNFSCIIFECLTDIVSLFFSFPVSCFCYGFYQESKIEQASLCIMDGAPWWREGGTCSQLTYLFNFYLSELGFMNK
jgi:hypothetical protein